VYKLSYIRRQWRPRSWSGRSANVSWSPTKPIAAMCYLCIRST